MESAARRAVTLQISLAPNDLPHAVHTVPHQLRQLAGQVDEIELTLDLHRSGGRYGSGWAENLPAMEQFVEQLAGDWPTARACRVDYSEQARRQVGEDFLG